MHADLKGARGADAHKGTRTTNTGKGVQGTSRHKPTGGNGRTQGHPPHLVHKTHYTCRDTWGHTETCRIGLAPHPRGKKNVFRTEVEHTENPRGVHRQYRHRNRQTHRNGPKTHTYTRPGAHTRYTDTSVNRTHTPPHSSSAQPWEHPDTQQFSTHGCIHRTEIHPQDTSGIQSQGYTQTHKVHREIYAQSLLYKLGINICTIPATQEFTEPTHIPTKSPLPRAGPRVAGSTRAC